jgi:DNA-binding CsgD family transcriptional regulator
MGLILPHLRRAVAIGRIVELHKVEAASLGDAVDAISAGVFLVTEGAVIVWTNASGRRMLDARLILHADRGRLAPMDKASAGQFHQAIEAAGAGHMVVGSRRPAVPLGGSEQEEPYVAHVLPLTSGRRRQAGVRYAATAAVFVHKAAMTGLTPIEAIAQHFQLTPAEVRVLIAIVDVGGVQEVAAVLGISEATVKTHLQRVFAKTETHRQADLVKIVAGFANPLIS